MAETFVVQFELDARDAQRTLQNIQATLRNFDSPEMSKLDKQLGQVNNQSKRTAQTLASTRYALYDVSQTLGVVGTAMTGLAVATYAVGIAWERNFANVIRTSGLREQVSDIITLRENFQRLASTIPVASRSLAEIGTLAGQLGIAAGDVTQFTSTVARFSATTDLSVEQAATAFGRLNALLPDVKGNFEALGSSILKVGTNSVATESDIAQVSTQISSMGAFAGLTAADVIGLSGALSSVGVAPELARGTVTRLFTNMSRAVAEGGVRLERFAEISGVAASQFKSAWGTSEFGNILLRFMRGIQNDGGNAVAVLNELGIASVRDVPALLRLANAADSAGRAGGLLAQTFADARSGFSSASELAQQYAVIQETIAAKLQLVANNFENLLAAISQGGGVFGGLLDALNGVLETLTEIARNPVTNVLLQLGVIVAGLIGALGLLAAAAAASAAGMLAIQQALAGLSTAGVSFGLKGIASQLVQVGVSANVANTGVSLLSKSLRTLGLAAAVGLSFELFKGVTSVMNSLTDAILSYDNTIGEVINRVSRYDSSIFTNQFLGGISDLSRGLANLGITGDQVARDLKQLDDTLAGLASEGKLSAVNKILEEIANKQGISIDELLNRLPELRKQLDLYAVSNGNAATSGGDMAASAEAQAEALQDLADASRMSVDELTALGDAMVRGSSTFVSFESIIKNLQDRNKEWAKSQAEATGVAKSSWEDFYQEVSIGDFQKALSEQIDAQRQWSEDISFLAGVGAKNFAAQIAAGGVEWAGLAAQARELTAAELMKLEEDAALAAFLASDAFKNAWTQNLPALTAAYEAGGITAVKGLIHAQTVEAQTKTPGAVAEFVRTWNNAYKENPIKMPVGVDLSPATKSLDDFTRNAARGKVIRIPVTTGTVFPGSPSGRGYATGGHIRGPGTTTSDSIPAWLSDGEFVMRASAVRKYGVGFMQALNRGAARFASGGYVGGATTFPSTMGVNGVVELGPRSLGVVRSAVAREVSVMLDANTIGRAVDAYNKNKQFQGIR